MATLILNDRIDRYHLAAKALEEARAIEFKPQTPVRIHDVRFKGYGLVLADESCPMDKLSVLLENGNIWWYPLENCSTATRSECPNWLKEKINKPAITTVRKLRKSAPNETV